MEGMGTGKYPGNHGSGHKNALPFNPNSDSAGRRRNLVELQTENAALIVDNDILQGQKAELARQRALMADVIYALSEPDGTSPAK